MRWPTRWPLQPLQPLQKTQLQPPFGPSVDSLCHPWFTTTNLSYRFPIIETSATALCGTTGIHDMINYRVLITFRVLMIRHEIVILFSELIYVDNLYHTILSHDAHTPIFKMQLSHFMPLALAGCRVCSPCWASWGEETRIAMVCSPPCWASWGEETRGRTVAMRFGGEHQLCEG